MFTWNVIRLVVVLADMSFQCQHVIRMRRMVCYVHRCKAMLNSRDNRFFYPQFIKLFSLKHSFIYSFILRKSGSKLCSAELLLGCASKLAKFELLEMYHLQFAVSYIILFIVEIKAQQYLISVLAMQIAKSISQVVMRPVRRDGR
jgi:hypothetical protein